MISTHLAPALFFPAKNILGEVPAVGAGAGNLLLEDSFDLLLETGDVLLME